MTEPPRFRFSLGNLLGMMLALGFIFMMCTTLDMKQGMWITFGKIVLGMAMGVGMLLQLLFSGSEGVRGALLFGFLSMLLMVGLAGWLVLLMLIIEHFGTTSGYITVMVYVGTTILVLLRPWRNNE